jgi:hypothetical protein
VEQIKNEIKPTNLSMEELMASLKAEQAKPNKIK